MASVISYKDFHVEPKTVVSSHDKSTLIDTIEDMGEVMVRLNSWIKEQKISVISITNMEIYVPDGIGVSRGNSSKYHIKELRRILKNGHSHRHEYNNNCGVYMVTRVWYHDS